MSYGKWTPVVVKGRDAPLRAYAPLAARAGADLWSGINSVVRAELGSLGVAAAHAAGRLEPLAALGDECTPSAVRDACRTIRQGAPFRTDGEVGDVAGAWLSGVGGGGGNAGARAAAAGLAGKALEGLQFHHQIALRAACVFAHRGIFSVALIDHIFRASFPHLAASFAGVVEVPTRVPPFSLHLSDVKRRCRCETS